MPSSVTADQSGDIPEKPPDGQSPSTSGLQKPRKTNKKEESKQFLKENTIKKAASIKERTSKKEEETEDKFRICRVG